MFSNVGRKRSNCDSGATNTSVNHRPVAAGNSYQPVSLFLRPPLFIRKGRRRLQHHRAALHSADCDWLRVSQGARPALAFEVAHQIFGDLIDTEPSILRRYDVKRDAIADSISGDARPRSNHHVATALPRRQHLPVFRPRNRERPEVGRHQSSNWVARYCSRNRIRRNRSGWRRPAG